MSFALLCRIMNRSRQSYYKARKAAANRTLESEKLQQLIQPIRKLMPRLGGRKIHFLLQPALAEKAIKIGRDKLFRWLRQQDLLVKPKRLYVHTTQSNHRFWVYNNLAADLAIVRMNQLWVSDITYLRTQEGFCYLALITDAYSRKIVGYDVSDNLELEGCRRALNRALHTVESCHDLVHHSDRGVQYCSNEYTSLLKQRGIKISMAAAGNCYENALAERVNGILKGEFNLDATFKTKALAIQAVNQSIYIYNHQRPHLSLHLKTPVQMHAA